MHGFKKKKILGQGGLGSQAPGSAGSGPYLFQTPVEKRNSFLYAFSYPNCDVLHWCITFCCVHSRPRKFMDFFSFLEKKTIIDAKEWFNCMLYGIYSRTAKSVFSSWFLRAVSFSNCVDLPSLWRWISYACFFRVLLSCAVSWFELCGIHCVSAFRGLWPQNSGRHRRTIHANTQLPHLEPQVFCPSSCQ